MRLFAFILLFFFYSCTNKTIYSGKILNQEDLSDINFENKSNLLNKLGNPSFIDPLEKKYFYFSEKKYKRSIFNKKTNYSYVFVFSFDDDDKVIKTNVYDLKNSKNTEFINEETSNEIVKRGLLERIFGGIGPQQQLPNSP